MNKKTRQGKTNSCFTHEESKPLIIE